MADSRRPTDGSRAVRRLGHERDDLAVDDLRKVGGRLHEVGILVGRGEGRRHDVGVLDLPDVVDLVELQLEDPGHWAGRTFNVGGGQDGSLSLLETTALCRELSGREVEIGADPATRAGDVRSYVSDCSALFAHTDWRPKRSPRDVLQDIHRWIADHENLVLTALG